MKRRMLAVLMSVAMAVGMMATGGAAKAAESDWHFNLPVQSWNVWGSKTDEEDGSVKISIDQNSADYTHGIHTKALQFKNGQTYRATIEINSAYERDIYVGPDSYLRDGVGCRVTVPQGDSTVTATFTMTQSSDADFWLMLGDAIDPAGEGEERVYPYDITVKSVDLYCISDPEYIIKKGADDDVWALLEDPSTNDTYEEMLVDPLYQLAGEDFKTGAVASVRAAGALEGVETFIDQYIVENNIPVPKALGYQYGTDEPSGGNKTFKDIRFVYSVPDVSQFEVTEVGVEAINPYFAQAKFGTGDHPERIDPDYLAVHWDPQYDQLVKGTASTFYTSVTGLGAEGFTENDNTLYITVWGNNFNSNFNESFGEGQIPSRAYVKVKAGSGEEVTLYSNVGLAKLESYEAE